MNDTYLCSFKYCQHESRGIPRDEVVVGSNNKKYHKDCYELLNAFKKIRDMYYQYDNIVNMINLVKVIKNILYVKKVNPKFAVFAVRIGTTNKYLKSPYGLYYLINNKEIIEKYKAKQIEIKANKIKEELEKEDINPFEHTSTFTYTCDEFKGFGSILKGR